MLLPLAKISLKTFAGDWIDFAPLVDSGAVVSVFNRSDSEMLGYELVTGRYCELVSASRHKIPCYVHRIEMRIGTEVIRSDVAFSTRDDMGSGYLGRVDVFDNFEVCLSGKKNETRFAGTL